VAEYQDFIAELAAKRASAVELATAHERLRASIRGDLFPQQLAVLDDPDKFKVVLCPRRAGKSFTAAAYMLDEALRRPGCRIAYVALTIKIAKRICWAALKKLDKRHKLGCGFNANDLSCTTTNGSSIIMLGLESEDDADKLRGEAFSLVIFDESSTYRPEVLEYAIDQCAVPTLADTDGALVLAGTPGRYFRGPFWEASNPHSFTPGWRPTREDDEDEANPEDMSCIARPYARRDAPEWAERAYAWSYHQWTAKDNVAVPGLWERLLAHKARKGWADDNPIWEREYLAKWRLDAAGYCYPYDPALQDFDQLPPDHDWHYLFSADLGTKDAFACSVGAWAPTCMDLYIVDEYHASGLAPHEWKDRILEFQGKYGSFDEMTVDAGGLGTAIVQDFKELYDLYLRPVDKTPGYKETAITMMADNMKRGRVKIRQGSALAHQMMTLQWKHLATRKVEDPGAPNDLCDAALGVFRYSPHDFSKVAPPKPVGARAIESQRILDATLAYQAKMQASKKKPGGLRASGWKDWKNR
jgi:hypothetical protein